MHISTFSILSGAPKSNRQKGQIRRVPTLLLPSFELLFLSLLLLSLFASYTLYSLSLSGRLAVLHSDPSPDMCVDWRVDMRMLCDAVYAFYIFRRNEYYVASRKASRTAATAGREGKETGREGAAAEVAAHCEISNFRFLPS